MIGAAILTMSLDFLCMFIYQQNGEFELDENEKTNFAYSWQVFYSKQCFCFGEMGSADSIISYALILSLSILYVAR